MGRGLGHDRLAVSILPSLLRGLPSLMRDAATNERDPDYVVTIAGLILYVAAIAGVLVVLDIE